MPKCKKLRRLKRQVCIGDLDNQIVLQDRSITPPVSGVDATEDFTTNDTVDAKVDTSRGETIFDGVSPDGVDVTHIFTIRFITGITAETWVGFKSQRFDILDVENLEERDEWLKLRCTNRGTATNAATEA